MQYPVIYSFRRCPYAMRARVAIRAVGAKVIWREILLKDKPKAMLEASPKGTVPVLVLADSTVIDESRDVMDWAFKNYPSDFAVCFDESQPWLDRCDNEFKYWLDRYKYSVGYPEQSELYYREQAEQFLAQLEAVLSAQKFLLGDEFSAADIGVFPFVRQFAMVDYNWFSQSKYTATKAWLEHWLQHPWFTSIMNKTAPWQPGDEERFL